jgi:hypothetical protein
MRDTAGLWAFELDGRWHSDAMDATRGDLTGVNASCGARPGLFMPTLKPASSVNPALLCRGCWS